MIDINLSPETGRKKRNKNILPQGVLNLPREAIIGLIGGLVFCLAINHLALLVITVNQLSQKKKMDAEWQKILPEKKTAEAVINEFRSIQGRLGALEKITTAKRVIWAPKLNAISDSIPRGVWLQKINVDEGIFTLEGSSISKDVAEEMTNVLSFDANLKNQKGFMNRLKNVELGPIQKRKIQTTEITDFSMTAKLQ